MHVRSRQHQLAASRELEVLHTAMGEQVLGLLSEEGITDIMLNPPLDGEVEGPLIVVRLGKGAEVVGTMSAEDAEEFIVAVASTLNRVATERSAIVEGKLIVNGARFTGIMRPVVSFPTFAIRCKASAIFSLQQYVEAGVMTARQKLCIEAAVISRKNIVVVGGTGSGKTTLMNAIIMAIGQLCPTHRNIFIEELSELQSTGFNQVFMVADENHSVRKLVRTSLRMFPHRIIVGEVRGAEALEMLMAWNTGHDGGVASLHSNITNVHAAIDRLADMVSMSADAPTNPGRLIGQAIGLIVCIELTSDEKRRVSQIIGVEGYDPKTDTYKLVTKD